MSKQRTSDLGASPVPPIAQSPNRKRRRTQATSPGSRQAPWPKELEGFNLGHYGDTSAFTSAQWGCQFAKRLVLRNALTSETEGQRALVDQLMPGLLTEPLAPYPYSKGPASLMRAGISVSSGPKYAVRALMVGDLDRLREQVSACANGLSAIDDVFHQQGLVHAGGGLPVGNPLSRFVHLMLDLSAPDNVLLEQLKRLIDEARQQAGWPEVYKHVNSPMRSAVDNHAIEAQHWRKFNVLPWLDIQLAAQYHNLPMPSKNALLDRLSPDKSPSYLDGTKKHADDCLTWKRIDELLLI